MVADAETGATTAVTNEFVELCTGMNRWSEADSAWIVAD
jgi:hypothetical protein